MVFIIIISLYSLLMCILAWGFTRLEEPLPGSLIEHSISVIIPVRNETRIPDLEVIQYPDWEAIIVDDNSNVPIKISGPNIRTVSSAGQGKKAAITTGIAIAKGDIIVTTDADCIVTSGWLGEINKGFQDAKIKMLVGGVRIHEDTTFFSRLQALEFVSVALTGAATLGLGIPTMCSGANLSYRKQSFIDVNGYEGNEKISSGDDEFLMNKFDRNSVKYLYSKESLVSSLPLRHVRSFVDQRLRWASKWQTNTSLTTKLFAVLILLFQISFLVMPFVVPLNVFLWLFLAKAFVDSMLLIPACIFFGVKWRWTSFIVLQFIYPVYVISIGLLSQVVLPKWKDRVVRTKV
jgi:cellulose synthase/poly-beta-1,6-N-acetylglucosamine synthase-like glycosyltransferase